MPHSAASSNESSTVADPSDAHGPADVGHGEPVGSLGQETMRLLRALADDRAGAAHGTAATGAHTSRSAGGEHQCTTGWCPVCRVVGFVKENPEVVDEVGAAAMNLARTVRDAFDVALRQAAAPRDTPHERDDR